MTWDLGERCLSFYVHRDLVSVLHVIPLQYMSMNIELATSVEISLASIVKQLKNGALAEVVLLPTGWTCPKAHHVLFCCGEAS